MDFAKHIRRIFNSPMQKFEGLSEEQLLQAVMEIEMANTRIVARKRAFAHSGNRSQAVNGRRFANEQARKIRRKYKKHQKSLDNDALKSRRRQSDILDVLDPERISRWRPLRKRTRPKRPTTVRFKDFDFIESPASALEQLINLSEVECTESRIRVEFEDRRVVDAGAFLVLAEIWGQLVPVFEGGQMSRSVQKVLDATGLAQDMGIHFPAGKKADDVWAFPISRRRPKNTTTAKNAMIQPQEREAVPDKMCDLINKWLEVSADENDSELCWELSKSGRAQFGLMMGELLDNAERHSQPASTDGDWSVTAFMAKRRKFDSTKVELQCYLAFLSVGQSIAESLDDADPRVKVIVDDYCTRHKNGPCSKQTLATVVALQDTITGDPDAFENERGGTGLLDVVDFVHDLALLTDQGNYAKISIVTGQTCVRLSPPYISFSKSPETGQRNQWCNVSNSSFEPPDPEIVFDLPHHFPGTLVSVAFTLNLEYVLNGESDDSEYGNDDSSN